MSQTGRIYSITCKVNGKRYIGQTIKNVAERWKNHLQESKTKEHRPLYRAIKKYGQGMFVVRIIEDDIPINKLSEREVYWIEQFDTYNNGYNATTGGESNYNIREEVKEKISSSMTGLRRSDEFINKQRLAAKSRTNHFKVSGDGKHLRVKIRATNVQTGEVSEYNSLTEFCKATNLTNGNVSRAMRTGGICGGYRIERLSDNLNRIGAVGYDVLTGRMLYEFRSMREAGKVLGGDGKGVSKSIREPGKKSYKGCYWYQCCSI